MIIWLIVTVTILVVVIFLWGLSRGRFYRNVFADPHFYEIATGVKELREAALGHIISATGNEVNPLPDIGRFDSSAGLRVAYSIVYTGGNFSHHYSVSSNRGFTTRVLGEMVVLFIAHLLEIPLDTLTLKIGASTAHHASFSLSDEEQSKFAERPVPELTKEMLDAFRIDFARARKSVEWQVL